MMPLSAKLLGRIVFQHDGQDVGPVSRKGAALLAYLCLRPEGAGREDLAELLWGAGRLANLRQELYALRRLPGSSAWLEDGETVSVRAHTDVHDLESVLTDDASTRLEIGELLPGMERVASPAFVDWLELERSRVADLVARASRAVAERLQGQGRHAEALAAIDAALVNEPFDERLVRAAMRSAYACGDAAGAIERFESLREVLRKELGSSPADETRELADRIKRGEPLPVDNDIARLSPELRGLAQVAALAAGELDVEALARVVERLPLDVASDLARLEQSAWLRPDMTLNPAAARAVLSTTPAVVRRMLHKRIAEALAGDPRARPEVVAAHLLAAGNAKDAAPRLVEAAEQAIKVSEFDAAVRHLLRASWSSWEDAEVRLRALLLLEGCAMQLGDQDLQDAALSEAEELAWRLQTDRGLADVRMRRSRTLLRRGRTGEGLESALEALAIATRLDDGPLMAKARNAVGGAQFYAGDLDGAETSFLANATAAEPVERYRARNNLGSIAGIRGNMRESLAHLEEALTLGRAAGEHAGVVGTLNNLAATAERLGDYRLALKHFKEGLSLARQAGSAAHEGQMLINVSVVYARLGELGPAWNTAVEVEEIAEDHSEPRLLLMAQEQKAEVANVCGEHARALEWLASAWSYAVEIGDERKQAVVRAAQAVVTALLDPTMTGEAVAHLDELEQARLADLTPWLWLELACGSGDPDDVARFADRAQAGAGQSEHVAAVIDLARLRAGLLDGASGALLKPAAEAHASLSERLSSLEFQQAPHARLLCARWLAVRGGADRPDGRRVSELIDRSLAEQAMGLPRGLASSLRDRPEVWSRGLRGTALSRRTA